MSHTASTDRSAITTEPVVSDQQTALERHDSLQYAAELQLDVARFKGDWADAAVVQRVARYVASGVASGEVEATPALFIDRVAYRGAYDGAALLEALGR